MRYLNPAIIKRVKKENYSKNNFYCYICGKRFHSGDCPHDVLQQQWALEEVQKMELLYVRIPE